jgi:hypothetical protein
MYTVLKTCFVSNITTNQNKMQTNGLQNTLIFICLYHYPSPSICESHISGMMLSTSTDGVPGKVLRNTHLSTGTNGGVSWICAFTRTNKDSLHRRQHCTCPNTTHTTPVPQLTRTGQSKNGS